MMACLRVTTEMFLKIGVVKLPAFSPDFYLIGHGLGSWHGVCFCRLDSRRNAIAIYAICRPGMQCPSMSSDYVWKQPNYNTIYSAHDSKS